MVTARGTGEAVPERHLDVIRERPRRHTRSGRRRHLGVLGLLLLVPADARPASPADCAPVSNDALPSLELRKAGRLEEALRAIDDELGAGVTPCAEIKLRLERARVLDRIGLHTQTRPVTKALDEIERAYVLVSEGHHSPSAHAEIELARANYHYRAEMARRDFVEAESAARKAIELARTGGSPRLEADAVHQLGLIRAYQRKTAEARTLFDRSLELDRNAGGRDWMLGEYHRHVALSLVFDDDWESALEHYRKSHQARVRDGALDRSIFSAMSLGDALVRTGSGDKALPFFEYAYETALGIQSSYAVASSSLRIAEELARQNDDIENALRLFSVAAEAARKVDRASLVERAESGKRRLRASAAE